VKGSDVERSGEKSCKSAKVIAQESVMKHDDPPTCEENPDIAIIGMAGRFPGAANVDEFWENLRSGVESISFFSDEELIDAGVNPAVLSDPNYVKAAPILEDPEWFDASFFGYSPREAQFLDPQHRLFLECAWEAIEHAGYDAEAYPGAIGVYAGSAMNTYLLFSGLLPHLVDEFVLTLTGSDKDFLTTRVSYKLNLTGPSVTVQTGCSTSLVAVHIACQSLLNGECDMALAGGVSVRVPHRVGYFYQEGSIFTPDGHCRAFDAQAKGTIFGSGVAIVVLKRLVDAIAAGDCIHAVVKGSAINNDGSAKANFTTPSMGRQADDVVEAMANAGITADTISYVETHGTGTALGDPIEIAALTKAFRTDTQKKGFCAIGSVKSNIGHLDAAAGVAGLIKTVLALKYKMIPPSLHFQKPNPEIDFANTPFFVNSKLSAWQKGTSPHRAGINALGVGGTNAHVILEEAPVIKASGESRSTQLLLLSSKTRSGLEQAATNLARYLAVNPQANLADVAYTLQVGRKHFNYRQMLVCRNHDAAAAVAGLRAQSSKSVVRATRQPVVRNVVFMFPGQGVQYTRMALELYRAETEFQARIDQCAEILEPHLSLDLRDILYPAEENIEWATRQLNQTSIAQPALFTIEYALAKLWMSWGVNPSALIGHSVGEYVAAHLAGVFSLEDALSLVAIRGRLMQDLPGGAMLAVPLSETEIQPFLNTQLSLAVVNGPSLCVVSGETDAVETLEKRLATEKLNCRQLRASHAFHSAMMDPILDSFHEQVTRIGPHTPRLPFISNVTGTWITSEEATDPGYWTKHVRQTVRFADGLQELLKETDRVLLEVGPGQTLSTLAKQYRNGSSDQIVLPSLCSTHDAQPDDVFLLNVLGRLWLLGVEVDWTAFHINEQRHRLPLPTYPFQRQKYWFEMTQASAVVLAQHSGKTTLHQRARSSSNQQRNPSAESQNLHLEAQLGQDSPASAERELVEEREMMLGAAYVAARTPVEQVVAGIWQEVLGIPQVGRYDDFFELGGHSVLVLQIISRLNQTFQVELSELSLLESPNVAGLAQCIEAIYRIEHGVAAPTLCQQ
jgi:phthiocerol/phenolphthiocerol synthesis type-I polyketide synthase E